MPPLVSAPTSIPEPHLHSSHVRKQSQHSSVAKSAIMSGLNVANRDPSREAKVPVPVPVQLHVSSKDFLIPPAKSTAGRLLEGDAKTGLDAPAATIGTHRSLLGTALTDTPASTAPNSPRIHPFRRDSASSTPRIRPTTLDIPGLTKSKVSPDGRIASRDIGSKLVIVMVGLPARGKSYITKKMARYLNWLQHDTRIFNVGERRRVAAGGAPGPGRSADPNHATGARPSTAEEDGARPSVEDIGPKQSRDADPRPSSSSSSSTAFEALPPPAAGIPCTCANGRALPPLITTDPSQTPAELAGHAAADGGPHAECLDQSASFFDPKNRKAAQLREQVAMATLDELLDYILDQGGSVGILDATNSTLERRKAIMQRVRERAGPHLGVLFLESRCVDQNLLESNMRLKLSGPDYKDQDPVTALADFKKRVAIYERSYVPLGEFEEQNNMQYVQMIDVGRKIVSHQIRGFLAAQTVYYLVNFNLSPRQIWITRHGESTDNVRGRIGGNSELSENGQKYARALTSFIAQERKAWTMQQLHRAASTHFPPHPGDTTPPYATSCDGEVADKNFCVWTSMLKRSIQTAQYFDEEDYDVKQMRMLNELNVGDMEGKTYEEIRAEHAEEYELRKRDKLHYRYPGAGGEGYLDVINRLRAVIVEVERMTDHVLLLCHRSVARVLLAYFLGLSREAVADVDVPLGVLYMLEPKPYGVDFKAFRYDPSEDSFHRVPDYELRRTSSHS